MNKLLFKPPKGTFDLTPAMCLKREWALQQIVQVFKLHGAVQIDTPVFELSSVLRGKYGEDEKLIYDLKDQGGEELSLRYDLTVPFARYLSSNGVKRIKRYQIGKVYRRDNPSIQQGRYREFMQCDFDICGQYQKYLSDGEVLSVMGQCMDRLCVKPYNLRVNHKLIVNGILGQIGVSSDQDKYTSSIDKLDKLSWDVVAIELNDKGLNAQQIDSLHSLLYNTDRNINEQVDQGRIELEQIIGYANKWGVQNIQIDYRLMRGLSYYSGMIVECDIGQNVSVGGGGRYDGLINKLDCVGMSIGVDRLLNYIDKQYNPSDNKQISILSIGNSQDVIDYMVRIHRQLMDLGICAHLCLNPKWKLDRQIEWTLKEQRQYAIIVGDVEVQNQCMNLKNLISREQSSIQLDDIVNIIQLMSNQH